MIYGENWGLDRFFITEISVAVIKLILPKKDYIIT